MEIQVRTPLIFPDDREALGDLLRGLGYEQSTEEVPRFSLECVFEPRLTRREEEILRLRVNGQTYWEIANTLGIASGVMRTHVRRIKQKLQFRQRSKLPRWFFPEAGRAFVLWLADTAEAAAAEELAQAVAGWIAEHLTHVRRGGTVLVICGPEDTAQAQVPILPDE